MPVSPVDVLIWGNLSEYHFKSYLILTLLSGYLNFDNEINRLQCQA